MSDSVIGYQRKKRVSIVNYTLILLAILGLPYFFVFYSMNLFFYSWLIVGFIFCYILCFILNRKGQYKISAIGTIFFPSLAIFIYASAFTQNSGIQYSLIGISSFSLLFFPENKLVSALSFSFPLLSFLLLEVTGYNFLPHVELKTNIYYMVYIISIMSSFSLIFIFMRIFNEENKQFKEKLLLSNQNIAQKTKLETEYKIARQLQSQFLPSDFPKFPNFKIEHVHYPSRNVSGDFFDSHSFGKNKVGFLVLDVTGKGLWASFITVRLHSFFHTIIKANHSPKKVLSILNKEICKLNVKKKGCVCFYLDLNPDTGEMRYSDSGLGVAFLLRNGELKGLRDEGGLILGAMDGSVYTEGSLQLEKGDAVLIGSDGITDVENRKGEKFGDDRLEALLKEYNPESDTSLKDTLEQTLLTFSGNLNYPEDDLTFLTIEHL